MEELDSYAERRWELRRLHTGLVRSLRSDHSEGLDGSIKKNTGFIKKLKGGITSAALPSLIKDVASLKLEKYTEEIATTIGEGLYRNSADIIAAVEIISLLHVRFVGFSSILVATLAKQFRASLLKDSEKEETTRVTKLRSSLRMLIELYLCGIIDDSLSKGQKSLPISLVSKDHVAHANVSVIVTFCKFFGTFFLPTEDPTPSQSVAPNTIASREQTKEMHGLVLAYFDSLKKQLVSEYSTLKSLEASHQENYFSKGEASEERKSNYEKALKSWEKLHSSASSFASILGQDLPSFKDEQVTRIGIGISDAKNESRIVNIGIWEDEEAKAFYEDLLDLQNRVPPIVLGMKKSLPVPDLPDPESVNETEPRENVGEDPGEDVGEDAGEDEGRTNKAALSTFLESLLTAANRNAIDELAVQYAFLNTKTARKRLIAALVGVPRHRTDLLPYYARLIATLHPYFPEIGAGVIGGLEEDFQYRQRKKDQVLIEEKIKNIKFMGELTKFKVAPFFVAFHYIKVLLDDFSHHNIDLLCTFLETCGRFLYRCSETQARTIAFLDIMSKKKSVQTLESRLVMMIENAIYECNPPETVASHQKVRSPIERFLKKLIYKDLSTLTCQNILKLLRKFNWNDPVTFKLIQKAFFKIHKVRFSTIKLMAYLVAELTRFYPDFGVSVVDHTIEEIRMGLELNLFKHNQQRIAFVAYLGELYNNRMVFSDLIFETLYLFVRFGHPNSIPTRGVSSPLDSPHDFFRLRLVCVLLDTTGRQFNGGPRAIKLDNFLVFLQMYMFTKHAMPMDVDFFVTDTLELLRPRLQVIATYEDSITQVNQITLSQMNNKEPLEDEVEESRPLQEQEQQDQEQQEQEQPGEPSEKEEEGSGVSEEEPEDQEEEEAVVHMQHLEETDQDFEREYSLLMQESFDSRRNEKRVASLDDRIPSKSTWSMDDSRFQEQEGTVAFTFLTRKGNKQQAKKMALPSDSSLAISTLSKQQAEQAERLHLKELTLNYEERERQNAILEMEEALRMQESLAPGAGKSGPRRVPGLNNPNLKYCKPPRLDAHIEDQFK